MIVETGDRIELPHGVVRRAEVVGTEPVVSIDAVRVYLTVAVRPPLVDISGQTKYYIQRKFPGPNNSECARLPGIFGLNT